MKYYIKTNESLKELDSKMGIMISIHIINKIIKDHNNYCLLETIYNNINKYAKKEKIFLYKNDKYRNLNTYIKKNNKSILNFIKKFNIYSIENNVVFIKNLI